MIKRVKLPQLDTVGLMRSNDSLHEFPSHYHETFCISLIESGTFGENELIVPTGSILISHPFEVHHNYLVKNIAYTITTFYVNADVMKSVNKSEYISFRNKVISDQSLFRFFKNLAAEAFDYSSNGSSYVVFEQKFLQGAKKLIKGYGISKPFSNLITSDILAQVKYHISKKLVDKITLDELAWIVGMNKYKFIRWFKENVGLTPFDYIIINRIEEGIKMIKEGKPLAHIAIDTGFYDQSNFSNYFKRYVGVTPKSYKENCNIFQDIRHN